MTEKKDIIFIKICIKLPGFKVNIMEIPCKIGKQWKIIFSQSASLFKFHI